MMSILYYYFILMTSCSVLLQRSHERFVVLFVVFGFSPQHSLAEVVFPISFELLVFLEVLPSIFVVVGSFEEKAPLQIVLRDFGLQSDQLIVADYRLEMVVELEIGLCFEVD